MLWIFTTVILLALAFATRRIKFGLVEGQREPSFNNTTGPRVFLIPILAVWLVFTALASTNTIEAGQIGLVKTFGEFTGQQSPGLNFKAPYQGVTEVDGRILKHRINMTGGDKGSAVSSETQPIYAKLEINYQLQLDEATKLYSSVGEDYYKRIVEPRVQQAFKAETVKYKTIDIAPKREKIREDVRKNLDKQLEEYGIDVTALTIRDLDFGQKFMDAIEDKQAATEQAKAAEERVAIAKAEADSAVATARGKAQSAVVAAEGEARALNVKGAALRRNPNSLELSWIEKINPQVQVIYLDPNGKLVQIPGFNPAK